MSVEWGDDEWVTPVEPGAQATVPREVARAGRLLDAIRSDIRDRLAATVAFTRFRGPR